MKFVPTQGARRLVLAVIVVGLAVGGLSLTLLVSQSSVRVESIGRGAVLAEMDRVRSRLGPGLPCTEAEPGDRARSAGPAPQTVHVLAWEHEDERLVRASTPYWALRVAGWKVAFARTIAPPLVYVALPEIERCGRGLIVDRRTAGGGRVLVWAE